MDTSLVNKKTTFVYVQGENHIKSISRCKFTIHSYICEGSLLKFNQAIDEAVSKHTKTVKAETMRSKIRIHHKNDAKIAYEINAAQSRVVSVIRSTLCEDDSR